jgi:carbonic anhydrase
MQKLADGVHAFRAQFFTRYKQLFRQLVDRGQEPETLFITCSDSRVVPTLITNAGPGDLFIVRNVGNIVPSLAMPGGTAAAIEYAVEVLDVKNVVVCGHTHCGAIQAMLHPERMEKLRYIGPWLAQTEPVRRTVAERYAHLSGHARETAAAEENVLFQLENLRAFPFVAEKLEAGSLFVSGWMFKLETGDVFEYDPAAGQFVDIASSPPPSSRAR